MVSPVLSSDFVNKITSFPSSCLWFLCSTLFSFFTHIIHVIFGKAEIVNKQQQKKKIKQKKVKKERKISHVSIFYEYVLSQPYKYT